MQWSYWINTGGAVVCSRKDKARDKVLPDCGFARLSMREAKDMAAQTGQEIRVMPDGAALPRYIGFGRWVLPDWLKLDNPPAVQPPAVQPPAGARKTREGKEERLLAKLEQLGQKMKKQEMRQAAARKKYMDRQMARLARAGLTAEMIERAKKNPLCC